MSKIRLFPTLALRHDETPSSFASRLARLHGCQHVRSFCADMGLPLQGIVDGEPDAIGKLAQLSGTSETALQANAFVRAGHDYRIRGQKLIKTSTKLSHVRICPKCAEDDIRTSGLPPQIAVYDRIQWKIASIRTCAIHNIALIDLGVAEATGERHDFSCFIANNLNNLGNIPEIERQTSDLEQYLIARLSGARGVLPWPDSLEFHAAAKLCEILGAIEIGGRDVAVKNFSNDDWRKAGQAGFQVSAGGERAIRSFLLQLQQTFEPTDGGARDVPQGVFGALYKWAAYSAQSLDFDPFRAIFRQHLIETMPFGPGDVLFGQPVEQRIKHSIRTAAVAFGAHQKRLRKILAVKGLLSDGYENMLDRNVLFDAAKAQALHEVGVFTGMSLKELESYTGAGRVQARILFEHSFLKPIITDCSQIAISFATTDVDAFLERLQQGAQPVEAADPNQLTIPHAAKRANCGAPEILRMILEHELDWIGRLTSVTGYMAILVNVTEIKTRTRLPPLDGLTAQQLTKAMKTYWRVVKALTDNNILRIETHINPINRCPVEIVPTAVINEFRDTYASLFEIAQEWRIHPRKIKKELTDRGVIPALDPDIFHATFYRRSQI